MNTITKAERERRKFQRKRFERKRSEAHWRVRYWIAQTETRIVRSLISLAGGFAYQQAINNWPGVLPLSYLMSSNDGENIQNHSLIYASIFWLVFSAVDAIFLASWWIEVTPWTRQVLGSFSLLKFVSIRALVVRPCLAIIATIVYDNIMGFFLPHRIPLDDLCTLSFSFLDCNFAVLHNIHLLPFQATWQTLFSVMTATLLLLWMDSKYAFLSFIDPSKSALKYTKLYYELPMKTN